MKDKREEIERVARANLDPAIAEQWVAMLSFGVLLKKAERPRGSGLRRLFQREQPSDVVGWLGGLPRLASGASWPRWEDRGPLAHIATLDCSALWPYLPDELREAGFPESGLLSYFYFDGAIDGGVEVVGVSFFGTEDGAQVLYTPDRAGSVVVDPPADIQPYPRIDVSAEPVLTWPTWEHPRLYDGGRPSDGWDAVFDATKAVEVATPHHQIGGNPYPVQGPVEQEISHGLASEGGRREVSWTSSEVKKAADGWLLLGQFDTDDDVGFMWGDCGTLYYLIRPEDLANLGFERVAFTWQCC